MHETRKTHRVGRYTAFVALPAGEIIDGRFVLEAVIGRGAFGEVMRALDRQTGMPVAIKRLHMHLSEAQTADRFEREARLLARIESAHVVRYVAHGRDAQGRMYLALEWLEGEDLGRRQRTRPLSPNAAVEVARQAALGLHALHDAGIVHRDVKPANFFLVTTPDGALHVKLIDLGIARAPAEAALTLEGAAIGTPMYMSPEQARGDEHVTPRSDIFSLGVVLYELLSSRAPFKGSEPFAVLAKIVLEDPPALRALVPGIASGLESVVTRAMAKRVEDRFESVRDMALALAAVPRMESIVPGALDDVPTAQVRTVSRTSTLERRVVTAVFAGFSTVRDGDAAVEEFASVVARHGGAAYRTLGRRVIAVFGAERSSGDEVVRAARAALAASETFPTARFSLSTGRALSGGPGLSGEAIDRGAGDVDRGAPGIRVDAATARLLASGFVISGDEGQQVLRGERAASTGAGLGFLGLDTPTVGREREVESLEDAYRTAVRERRPGAAVVLGPPGIGKSRLRLELVRAIAGEEQPETVLVLRGDPMLADVPLGMLSRALRHEAMVEPGASAARQADAVRAWATRLGLSSRAGMLGELLRVQLPHAGDADLSSARVDPGLMRTRLRETFAAVLSARASRGPVLVAVDDLQWADTATVEALGWSLDALPGETLFVVAFGRDEAARRFPALWSAASPLRLDLGALSGRASEALVRAVLGPGADAERVRSVVARAMGNPLFIEELLRAARTGQGDELPVAIQAAFQIRLDALAPATKRAALVASVFGSALWREALVALLPDIDVDAALSALVSAEILAERPRARFARVREFVFRHTLLRDAAYAMLSPDETARLHRAAGEWLEAAGEDDDASLAQHFERAGDASRAATRYLAAARKAAREGAYESALAHAERGISLGASGETLAALHAVAAQACHPLGRYAEGLTHGERAWALTEDPAQKLEVVAARSLTLRRSGDAEGARTSLAAALADLPPREGEPTDVTRARLTAQIEMAWVEYTVGRHAEAVRAAEEILGALPGEDHGLEAQMLSALHVLARGLQGMGELERALGTFSVLVERATVLGHRWRGEGARSNFGQLFLALGENAAAVRELSAARDNARALRLPSTEGFALHYLSIARARQGETAAAIVDQTQAVELARRIHNPALECAARTVLASLLVTSGDLERAAREAETARALSGAPRAWISAAGAALAGAKLAMGDSKSALEIADEIAAGIVGAGSTAEGDDVTVLLLLRVFDAAGRTSEAATLRAWARPRIEARLLRVRDPQRRGRMLDGIPEYRAILGEGEGGFSAVRARAVAVASP